MDFRKLLNGFAQSVVIRNDLDQVETFLKSHQAVDFGGSIHRQRKHRFLLSLCERDGNIIEQSSDVAAGRRGIEIAGGRKLLHLRSPDLHQLFTLLPDEIRQLRQIFVAHCFSLTTIRISGLRKTFDKFLIPQIVKLSNASCEFGLEPPVLVGRVDSFSGLPSAKLLEVHDK